MLSFLTYGVLIFSKLLPAALKIKILELKNFPPLLPTEKKSWRRVWLYTVPNFSLRRLTLATGCVFALRDYAAQVFEWLTNLFYIPQKINLLKLFVFKVKFLLHQMRLSIQKEQYTRATIISRKISDKFFDREGDEVFLFYWFYFLNFRLNWWNWSFINIWYKLGLMMSLIWMFVNIFYLFSKRQNLQKILTHIWRFLKNNFLC